MKMNLSVQIVKGRSVPTIPLQSECRTNSFVSEQPFLILSFSLIFNLRTPAHIENFYLNRYRPRSLIQQKPKTKHWHWIFLFAVFHLRLKKPGDFPTWNPKWSHLTLIDERKKKRKWKRKRKSWPFSMIRNHSSIRRVSDEGEISSFKWLRLWSSYERNIVCVFFPLCKIIQFWSSNKMIVVNAYNR